MESRDAFRGPKLLLTLHPLLVALTLSVALGCAGGLGFAEAPTAPEAALPAASQGGDGLAAMQRHIAEREYHRKTNRSYLT